MAGAERTLSAAAAAGFDMPGRPVYAPTEEARAASSVVPFAPKRVNRDWLTKQFIGTLVGCFLGALSHGMFNRVRFRPTWHQPWFGVVQIAGGASFGNFLGRFYDDTSKELDRQYSESARLPSWMHGSLSETELAVERRRETAAALRETLRKLAEAEEAEYLARRAEAAAAGESEAAMAAFEAQADDMIAAAGKAQAADAEIRAAAAALEARRAALVAEYEAQLAAAGLDKQLRADLEASVRAAKSAPGEALAGAGAGADAAVPADVAERMAAARAIQAPITEQLAAAVAEYQAVLVKHGRARVLSPEERAQKLAEREAAAGALKELLDGSASDRESAGSANPRSHASAAKPPKELYDLLAARSVAGPKLQ